MGTVLEDGAILSFTHCREKLISIKHACQKVKNDENSAEREVEQLKRLKRGAFVREEGEYGEGRQDRAEEDS
jgi:hypothetical protein